MFCKCSSQIITKIFLSFLNVLSTLKTSNLKNVFKNICFLSYTSVKGTLYNLANVLPSVNVLKQVVRLKN